MTLRNETEKEQTVPGELTTEQLDQVAGGKPVSGASGKNPVKYMRIEMDQVVISKVVVGNSEPPIQ